MKFVKKTQHFWKRANYCGDYGGVIDIMEIKCGNFLFFFFCINLQCKAWVVSIVELCL